MSSSPDFNEVVLARKIRRVLDESAAHVSDNAADRLAAARRMALACKKADAAPVHTFVYQTAMAGGPSLGMPASAPRGKQRQGFTLQLWLPLLVLAASLFGIAHWEEQKRVAELATLDAQVLSDALPLDAYLDHGFNEYLARTR